MSVYFSYLADELADIEERLRQADVAPYSTALRRAISSAYAEALLADRAAKSELAMASEGAEPDKQVHRAA